MKMKHNENNTLDEMQDQKMLKMEEYAYWILFWGLALAVVVQLLLGGSIRQVAGELIVLLIGGAYVLAASLKNGLWTRSSVPTRKRNAVASLIPAAVICVLNVIKLIQKKDIGTNDILIAAAFTIGTYVVCFAVLEVLRLLYEKRRSKLDDVGEE